MRRMSAAARAVVLVLAALVGVTVMATPAVAEENPNVRYTTSVRNAAIHEMRASYSWQCMDVRGESTSMGAVVQRFDCKGQLNQRFYFVRDRAPGTFTIRAYWQAYCVGPSATSGNGLVLNDCNTPGNVYHWVDRGNNHWEIVDSYGRCIRDNGRRVQLTLTTCAPVAEPYPTLWTARYHRQYDYGSIYG